MKITFLILAVVVLAFAEVARAQQASPSPTPQIGFRKQVFEPSADDPLLKATLTTGRDPQTTYDRFTDETNVWIPFDDLDISTHYDLSIMAFVTYRGKGSTKPEGMGIGFMSTPHEIESPEIRELRVLADGNAFR
ncbi:MAG TPA: hypothetical protein DC054_09150 [Blastocatellia bacterium]|nr:hypothetical protein [Blastocatellia bacterium]